MNVQQAFRILLQCARMIAMPATTKTFKTIQRSTAHESTLNAPSLPTDPMQDALGLVHKKKASLIAGFFVFTETKVPQFFHSYLLQLELKNHRVHL